MWYEKYIGIPYDQEHDCMGLAMEVAKELFNIDIVKPVYEHNNGKDQTRAITLHKDDVCERYTGKPFDGMPVLFLSHRRYYHIGVYVCLDDEGYILHSDSFRKSVLLTRLRDMERHGYTFEGFYKWKV